MKTEPSLNVFSQECQVADLFLGPSHGSATCSAKTAAASRHVVHRSAALTTKLDVFTKSRALCCALRYAPADAREMTFVVEGAYSLTRCHAGGWVLSPGQDNLGTYWLPRVPIVRLLDEAGHVRAEHAAPIAGTTLSSAGLSVKMEVAQGWVLDCTIWYFPPGTHELVTQLHDLATIERQPRFLWGSHTLYQRPADVYAHMIHGHVYENRYSWPKYWKICSENDAHALHTVLRGLEAATGKQLYRLLKDQLCLSVIERQDADGAWRHGEWTERMESHYRLHCSAMHLLMDALAEAPDPAVRKALDNAASFLARQTDTLDNGTWFLHDELERSAETMRAGPLPWLPSRALGKAEANMLVLNSHLDATVALDRHREVTGDSRHKPLIAQALLATRAVLALRPAEWLYRTLFRAIRLTFLPTPLAVRLPLHVRALKRLAWKFLVPLVPHVKARFPRIVMPGGYIDRELSMRVFAHDYLPINLMDLLRYRHRFPDEPLDDVIFPAIELVKDCRMFDRWPEIAGKEYALGFWAEALYQACLGGPNHDEYRARLAQAVVALTKHSLGLPPSLLGANNEAVAPSDQVPTPVTEDIRIHAVNLSTKDVIEMILVNCSDDMVHPRFLRNAPNGMVWKVGGGSGESAALPADIPPGGWLWGRGRRGVAAAS